MDIKRFLPLILIALLLNGATSSLNALLLEELIESNQLFELVRGKKVGYYTGSFDPIHKGHSSFAKGVIEEGVCDYVLIVPAWGKDGFKERAAVSLRIEMLKALFAQHPKIIVTDLSPLKVQQTLTTVNPDKIIRRYPAVRVKDEEIEFIGLIGSDTALNLSLPASDEESEINRTKRLEVFMRGVSIPEKYGETTIGSIMALPVSQFVVGLRNGDEIAPLRGFVGDRPIMFVHTNSDAWNASSSKVKERLSNGISVDDLIDPSVNSIIEENELYGCRP